MSAPLHSHSRACDRGMSDEVRDLSTRMIDSRAAAKGYALVALLAVPLMWFLAQRLWWDADDPTDASSELARRADPAPVAPIEAHPIVMLVIDGLRVDEADSLPAFRALTAEGARGQLVYPRPTLSTGGYHTLLTGAPNHLSNVKTNRFRYGYGSEGARLDDLADRARAAGFPVRVVAEGLDWMAILADPDGRDTVIAEGAAFDRAAREALLATRGAPGGLVLIHMLAVDESAHDGGIDDEAHLEALRRADALVAAARDALPGDDAVLVTLSDHGHLAIGGHGGDEPVVTTAPFALRAPGAETHVDAEALDRLPPECVAPLVSAWAGMPAPRSHTCVPELGTLPPHARPGAPAAFTSTPLERTAGAFVAYRSSLGEARARGIGYSALAFVLAFMGLGATKRAFSGFGGGTLLAPSAWFLGAIALHGLVRRKPFSLSAIDLVDEHLFVTGAGAALAGALGIGASMVLIRRRGGSRVMAARRASAGLGWAAMSTFGIAWASIGGDYTPWPESATAAYAPVYFASTGIGALLVSATILVGSVAKRWDVSYAPAEGAPGIEVGRRAATETNAGIPDAPPTAAQGKAQ